MTSSLYALRQSLAKQQHRQLLILSGEMAWQYEQLTGLFNAQERLIWLGNKSQALPFATVLTPVQLPHYLGQEIAGVVIDVRHGYTANALGILAGMIQAGGVMVLLTPDTSLWVQTPNPENKRFLNTPFSPEQASGLFTQHLQSVWQQTPVIWLSPQQPDPFKIASLACQPQLNSQHKIELPTPDQLKTVQAVHKVAFGHRKRPVVIEADRGRGKSASLGLAALDCFLAGKHHIVITAQRLEQAQVAFKQLLNELEDDTIAPKIEHLKSGREGVSFSVSGHPKYFQFCAPDALLQTPTKADLLLVDEAAHLPTPVLTQLLKQHHRIVFATTLHGYEGSGRGFALRFSHQLNTLTPNWKKVHCHTPIRWAENDPLEQAINQALLLHSATAELPSSSATEQVVYRTVSQADLLASSSLLQAVFGLLVQAHYQTTPNDLQQLLEAPNMHILLAQTNTSRAVIGVMLCVSEGKLSAKNKHAHGHLVPQLLQRYYAKPEFAMLATWRIMRIAVLPPWQNQGVGKRLLKMAETEAYQARVDYLSSSFGSSDTLLPFWFKQSFWPLHVGVKRDKASGAHNLVVAKPLTAMGRQGLSLIQKRFQKQFPHMLIESLPHFSATQIWPILQTFRFKQNVQSYEKALLSYQAGERPYEAISNQMWHWSLQSAHSIQQASLQHQAIWCDKIIKKQTWQEVAQQHNLAGRGGVEAILKTIIEQLVTRQP